MALAMETLFENQVQLLLSINEAKVVKSAIIEFISNKDVTALVAGLKPVLFAPNKSAMFETISHFIPIYFKPRYILETGFVDDADDEWKDYDEGNFQPPRQKSSMNTAMLHAAISQFEEEPPAVRPYAKTKANSQPIYDQPMEIPDDNNQRVRASTSNATKVQNQQQSASVPMSSFVLEPLSRAEAELLLVDNGKTAGSFLVRRREVDPSSVSKSWVLSYVQARGRVFSHQIIHQAAPMGLMSLGDKPRDQCTSLEQLIVSLKTDPSYLLKQPVYQAQSWFHGKIPREEAERRLAQSPSRNCYLVRKSVREDNTVIVSFVSATNMVIHSKLIHVGEEWVIDNTPKSYRSIPECLMANDGSNGWKICHPCVRKSDLRTAWI